MTALPKLVPSRMTVEEFLDWPGDGSATKFELVDGEPRAMAPASALERTGEFKRPSHVYWEII
jgi:Uma2 family endonuclease